MNMARATLESAVIDGLAKSAHLTGATAEHVTVQVADILASLFHPGTRWAVYDHLEELQAQDERPPPA